MGHTACTPISDGSWIVIIVVPPDILRWYVVLRLDRNRRLRVTDFPDLDKAIQRGVNELMARLLPSPATVMK